MMKRIVILLIVAVIGVVMLYLSRFWMFELWGRPGLFGIQDLRPNGGLLARWLRGTPFAPFELLIWATGVFLILTWVQKLVDFLTQPKEPEKDDAHDG